MFFSQHSIKTNTFSYFEKSQVFDWQLKMVFRNKYYCNENLQKQPSRGVLIKRCSGNMQQIYGRTLMLKCDCKATLLKSHFSMGVLL